jgi:hypothetical protein
MSDTFTGLLQIGHTAMLHCSASRKWEQLVFSKAEAKIAVGVGLTKKLDVK